MLEKVFIENYLSIYNKQELKISNRLTTLIGGNATGKSTILKAINKMNGEKINLKEKNINRLESATNISMKFFIDKNIRKKLNDSYQFNGKKLMMLPDVDIYYYLYLEENGDLKYELKDKNDNNVSIIELNIPYLLKHFERQLKGHNAQIKKKIQEYISNLSKETDILSILPDEEKSILDENLKNDFELLKSELKDVENNLLPNYKFIYMSSFKDILVDDILIDDIDKNKTVMNFLNIAGITKEEIIKAVDNEDQQKIRTIENKTISIVTSHFKKIFTQVKDDDMFKLSMTIDNKNKKLYFWIQNKITGESVLPFTSESEGMQWYLSMYLRLYEYFTNENQKTEYILLLDEPNIYLHAEAQNDLLKNVFKEKLNDVQIIYSTHSPYMIDADDLYSIRIIDKDLESKIFNTTIDYLKFKRKGEKLNDIDVLSPVLLSIGINISNQLTISPNDKIIVVEGPHEYYAFSAMKEILGLKNIDYKIIPCQGATKVPFMCSYLYGLGYSVTAVFDNDKEGRENLDLIRYQNDDLNLIHGVLYEKQNSDGNCLLEDLFSANDKKKYMPKKSTVNYRKIYDMKEKIILEQDTKDNFKHIFELIEMEFKKDE